MLPPLCLNPANQGLEMLHILCVGHIMGLVVHRHLLLCLLKGPSALLVVVEAAAVPSDDYKELHDVLVSLGAHKCGGPVELAVEIGRALLPDDKCIHVLLVLLKLDNFFLYHGAILLPDIYIPGVDNGLHSLFLWVPWYSQSWKAQRFDCLYDVCPTFILPLYVVGYGIDRFLVLGRAFHVSNVEGVVFESLHLHNKFLFDLRSHSPHGPAEFLGPSILGLASKIFSLPFRSVRLGMFHQGKPAQHGREITTCN